MSPEAHTAAPDPDWRSVVEHLDGAVIVVDLAGRIIFVNAAAAAYSATGMDDGIGSPVWELPELATVARKIEARFRAAARGAAVKPVRLRFVDAAGVPHVVDWHATSLDDAQGRPTHVLISGHDVTRQHDAERALRERDERYRHAFERADTIWWEMDVATGSSTWPAEADAFYGVSTADHPPSLDAWRQRLHPDDVAADERLTQKILDEGWETFEAVNRIIHPEKGLRWIRTHGRVVYSPDGEAVRLAGIDTDITEQRLAEERLRESEADFRTLADSLPQIVWTAQPDGRMDYFNRRWTEFTGLPHGGGKAWAWKPLLHPDDEPKTVEAWTKALASGASYTVEHRIRRHDGAYRWFMSRALPVRDEQGRVTKWFGTGTDVHDQKRAAIDLERRTAQQATVAELGLYALQESDIAALMRHALAQTCERLGVDLCKVLRLRHHADGASDLVVEAAIGFPEESVRTARVSIGPDSQAGFTLDSNAPVVVDDLETEERFRGPPLLREHGVVSGVSVVIHGTGGPYGVLGVHSTTRRTFDEADVSFVQSVANLLAEAVKRREAEMALVARVRRLDALHTIDNAIIDSTDVGATLRIIVEQIKEQLAVDSVAAFVYRDDLQALDFAAGAGFLSDAIRQEIPAIGVGRLGTLAQEKRIQHVHDLAASPDGWVRERLVRNEGFVTYFGIPLVVKGALEGVLEIFHRRALVPNAGWHDFLSALGTQTAIAINNSRLFADLQASNRKLRRAYDATIEGWARALELKDNQTEGHSRRVTDLSLRLARYLGVADDDLVAIERGALLHDIGKMGIPDAILLKDGALEPDEWEVMRSHPEQAYELLRPIEFLRDALDIPYAHHERWDGSGYPRGLAGERIPVAARIFAVADVYDALTSERPYWPAWTRERALEYVRDQAGRHFDPAIAAAFDAMMSGRAHAPR